MLKVRNVRALGTSVARSLCEMTLGGPCQVVRERLTPRDRGNMIERILGKGLVFSGKLGS